VACPDFDGGRILDFAAIIVRGGRYGTQGLVGSHFRCAPILLAFPVLCQNSADRLSSLPVIVVQDPCAFSRSAGRRLFGVSRERARSLRCLSLGVARDAPRPHLREAYRELDSGSGIPARWQKFPCSRTQGIRRLGPRERAGLETICLAGSRDLDNFPVFSLWIRDSGREMGSR